MCVSDIVDALAIHAVNSKVQYSDLLPFVNELNLEKLKMINTCLNKRGLSFEHPGAAEPDTFVNVDELRQTLGFCSDMSDKQRKQLSTEKMNRFNRTLLAAYQLAQNNEDKMEIQNAIVMANKKLIYYADKNLSRNKYEDDEDIEHKGIIGLIEAVKKYDFDETTSFASYAIPWIEKEIQRGCSKYPVSLRNKISIPTLTSIKAELEAKNIEDTFEVVSKRYREKTAEKFPHAKELKYDDYKDFEYYYSLKIVSFEGTMQNTEDVNDGISGEFGDAYYTDMHEYTPRDDMDYLEDYFEFYLTRPQKPSGVVMFIYLAHKGFSLIPLDMFTRLFNIAVQKVNATIEEEQTKCIVDLSKMLYERDFIFFRIVLALAIRSYYLPLNQNQLSIEYEDNEIDKIHKALNSNDSEFMRLLFSLDLDNQILLIDRLTTTYPEDLNDIAKALGLIAYTKDKLDPDNIDKNIISYEALSRYLFKSKKEIEDIFKIEDRKFTKYLELKEKRNNESN